jgi:hypothetical protein
MLVPRLVALTVIWLLVTSTFTFAAGGSGSAGTPAATTPPPRHEVLIVPDVRAKAYVFAKGILQDAGFAWKVEGRVQGYAANTVAVQNPAPGTKVVDNGAPTVRVRLARNAAYVQRGLPENRSPYEGTRVVLLSSLPKKPAKPKTAKPKKAGHPEEKKSEPDRQTRRPDFVVAGAPAEPADEMPLPARARRLRERLAGHPQPTARLVDFWLYQHSWIVTGARFGWKDGDEALRILIKVDEDLQRRWGIGARSVKVARSALSQVERQVK